MVFIFLWKYSSSVYFEYSIRILRSICRDRDSVSIRYLLFISIVDNKLFDPFFQTTSENEITLYA